MYIDNIEITVIRKKMKHLRLAVLPPAGAVRISAPLRVSDGEIRAFAAAKIQWIHRQVARFKSHPQPVALSYITGEAHYAFGHPYPLEVLEIPGKSRVALAGGTLLLAAPPGMTAQGRQAVLNEWYRSRLREALPPLFAKWEPVIGAAAAQVRIKNMSTRWGTCNTAAKRIWINLQLAKYPPPCLEYVVVHELAHLLEPSHSKRFTGLMDRFLPDWRARREALRTGP